MIQRDKVWSNQKQMEPRLEVQRITAGEKFLDSYEIQWDHEGPEWEDMDPQATLREYLHYNYFSLLIEILYT